MESGHYTASFDDLLDVDSNGNAIKTNNNQGLYVLAEYQVYRERLDPQQRLAVFARYGIANDDINQIGRYVGGGLVYTGLFVGRDEDQLGLAIAIATNGDKYRQKQQNSGTPVDGNETTIELSYRAPLLPWLSLQPDIQWIKNPGMNPAVQDATVFGLRAMVTF